MADLIQKLIYSPPAWVLAVLTTIVCAHAIHIASGFITKHKGPNGLIIIIELFILLVLGYLTLHLFLHSSGDSKDGATQQGRPYDAYGMLVALVLFGFTSCILYTHLKERLSGIHRKSDVH